MKPQTITGTFAVFVLLLGLSLLNPRLFASSTGMNVVLITVDTLRADHLGCYGNAQVATPNMDALAARGVRFASAYSQAPFTLPSHTSLFTGTYPAWNGVEDTTGPPLNQQIPTIAEILQQRGYATAGFPAAFVLDRFFGLGRGFGTYYGSFPHRDTAGDGEESGLTRTADEQLPLVFDWLDRNAAQKFFMWVHLYDTHHPYNPQEPYRTLYRDRPYDAEVATVDAAIGRLLNYLASKQLSNKTIVVLTSDHGEGLGEHGELYHGYFIYNTTLHVPLIVYDPALREQPATLSEGVRLLDVAPTLLQLLGAPIPAQMQGQSLVPMMSGKTGAPRPIYAESLFPQLHFGWSSLRSLQQGHFKYIDAPRPELYDLTNDPGETTNVFASRQAVGQELRARLRETIGESTRTAEKPTVQLSQETIKKLKALGYVADTPSAPLAPGKTLADPKDTLPLYNLYLAALSEQASGQLRAAVATYQKILASGYRPPIVYHGLGNVFLRLHENRAATENLELASAENPASEPYLLDLARSYELSNETRQAADTYVLALALNPQDFAARNNLAVMYIKLNQWDEAIRTLEAAAAESPLKETYYHLGICYEHQGKTLAAQKQFQKALGIDEGFAAAHYNLGVIQTALGAEDDAVAEFQSAIRYQPDLSEAHFSLGVLYARRSDVPAAKEELSQAVQLRPNFPEAHFNLAVVDMKLMHLEDAEREFHTALAARPGFIEAHKGLASLYGQMGLQARASDELEIAKRLELGREATGLSK